MSSYYNEGRDRGGYTGRAGSGQGRRGRSDAYESRDGGRHDQRDAQGSDRRRLMSRSPRRQESRSTRQPCARSGGDGPRRSGGQQDVVSQDDPESGYSSAEDGEPAAEDSKASATEKVSSQPKGSSQASTSQAKANEGTPRGSRSEANEQNISLSTCRDRTISAIVKGTYTLFSSNHERPVYKKDEKSSVRQSSEMDVFIYYWDERDGPDLCGWWISPSVGGDEVWAYHSSRTSMKPPNDGWNVPHDGETDPTFSITPSNQKQKDEGTASESRQRSDRVTPAKAELPKEERRDRAASRTDAQTGKSSEARSTAKSDELPKERKDADSTPKSSDAKPAESKHSLFAEIFQKRLEDARRERRQRDVPGGEEKQAEQKVEEKKVEEQKVEPPKVEEQKEKQEQKQKGESDEKAGRKDAEGKDEEDSDDYDSYDEDGEDKDQDKTRKRPQQNETRGREEESQPCEDKRRRKDREDLRCEERRPRRDRDDQRGEDERPRQARDDHRGKGDRRRNEEDQWGKDERGRRDGEDRRCREERRGRDDNDRRCPDERRRREDDRPMRDNRRRPDDRSCEERNRSRERRRDDDHRRPYDDTPGRQRDPYRRRRDDDGRMREDQRPGRREDRRRPDNDEDDNVRMRGDQRQRRPRADDSEREDRREDRRDRRGDERRRTEDGDGLRTRDEQRQRSRDERRQQDNEDEPLKRRGDPEKPTEDDDKRKAASKSPSAQVERKKDKSEDKRQEEEPPKPPDDPPPTPDEKENQDRRRAQEKDRRSHTRSPAKRSDDEGRAEKREQDKRAKEEEKRKDEDRKAKEEDDRKAKEEEMKKKDEELQQKRDEKRKAEEAKRKEEEEAKQKEMAEKRKIEEEERKKKEEEDKKRQEEEMVAIKQQESTLKVLAVLQKLASTTPSNFESLQKECDDILKTELENCGPQRELLEAEARQVVQYAKHYVHQELENKKKQQELKEQEGRVLQDLEELVCAAEKAAEEVQALAVPFDQQEDLDTDKVAQTAVIVDRKGRLAMKSCSNCADFITERKAMIEKADKIPEGGASKLSLVLPRIRKATAVTAAAFQNAKEKKELIKTRRAKKWFSDKSSKLFAKYDKDGDGFLNSAEVKEYAKGEFDFDIPDECVDRIRSQLVPFGVKGVTPEKCALMQTAIGVARHELKMKQRNVDRRSREEFVDDQRKSVNQKMEVTIKTLNEQDDNIKKAEAEAGAIIAESSGMQPDAFQTRLQNLVAVMAAIGTYLQSLKQSGQEISKSVRDVPEINDEVNPGISEIFKRLGDFEARLEKTGTVVSAARQMAIYVSLLEYERLWREVVVGLRVCLEQQARPIEELYDTIAVRGGDTISTVQIHAFLLDHHCALEKEKVDKVFGRWALTQQTALATALNKKAEAEAAAAKSASGEAEREEAQESVSREELVGMKESVLRALCKSRKLPDTGSKDEVVNRLHASYSANAGSTEKAIVAKPKPASGQEDLQMGTLLIDSTIRLTRAEFSSTIRMYYKVVRQCVLSDHLLIDQSKQLRHLQVGELIDVHRGPAIEPNVKIYRIQGRVIKDSIFGWSTIAGNQGITFLQLIGRIFKVKKEIALTSDLKDVEGSPLLRMLQEGEYLEVLEFAWTSRSALGVLRVQVRVEADQSFGWVTVRSNDGTVYLEELMPET